MSILFQEIIPTKRPGLRFRYPTKWCSWRRRSTTTGSRTLWQRLADTWVCWSGSAPSTSTSRWSKSAQLAPSITSRNTSLKLINCTTTNLVSHIKSWKRAGCQKCCIIQTMVMVINPFLFVCRSALHLLTFFVLFPFDGIDRALAKTIAMCFAPLVIHILCQQTNYHTILCFYYLNLHS